jgi:hypothetical protein
MCHRWFARIWFSSQGGILRNTTSWCNKIPWGHPGIISWICPSAHWQTRPWWSRFRGKVTTRKFNDFIHVKVLYFPQWAFSDRVLPSGSLQTWILFHHTWWSWSTFWLACFTKPEIWNLHEIKSHAVTEIRQKLDRLRTKFYALLVQRKKPKPIIRKNRRKCVKLCVQVRLRTCIFVYPSLSQLTIPSLPLHCLICTWPYPHPRGYRNVLRNLNYRAISYD